MYMVNSIVSRLIGGRISWSGVSHFRRDWREGDHNNQAANGLDYQDLTNNLQPYQARLRIQAIKWNTKIPNQSNYIDTNIAIVVVYIYFQDTITLNIQIGCVV